MAADELAFLQAILDNPHDDLPRLVYADWLDEHGHPGRAELIRLQHTRASAEADRRAIDARIRELVAAVGGPYAGAAWVRGRFQQCQRASRRWTSRMLDLRGWVNGHLGYHVLGGRGSRVTFDGTRLPASWRNFMSPTTSIHFDLPSPGGPTPARIDASFTIGLPTGTIALSIDDVLVYAEA
jgi:uncharacterized protein (TIGR02996 family)